MGTTNYHVTAGVNTYPEIGDINFKCALWTFKQQLTLSTWARCRIYIVLLKMSLCCEFRDTGQRPKCYTQFSYPSNSYPEKVKQT